MQLTTAPSQTNRSTSYEQSSKVPPVTLEGLKAEKAKRYFREFVEQAWHVLEPSTVFVPGVHVDAICEHLQAVTEGRIGDLIINVPPGHAKSLLTCVFWPAWVWIDRPETRWIFSSYRAELAMRDSVKCRTLLDSPWYQERWGDRFELRQDQNQKSRYENTRSGYRVIASVGAGTGERGDVIVMDDPTSVDQAESDTERRTATDFWFGTMSTRLNDAKTGHRVVIMQRLHEDDLTGNIIDRGGYELLMLPEEFEPDRACVTSIGWKDPRTEPGELLWPAKNGRQEIENIKRDLGSYRYAGQYQQRPSPAGGGIFKRWWWRYWQHRGQNLQPVQVRLADGSVQQVHALELPERFDQIIQSWDMAFKDLSTSDFVVGGVWAAVKADRFLLDQKRERLSFPKTVEAVKGLSEKWPQAQVKLIEDKANGPAVIDTLTTEVPALVAVDPEGGKEARAHAVSPQIKAGNVFLPHPSIAPWVLGLIGECRGFPKGAHDDQVDAMTQVLTQMIDPGIQGGVATGQEAANPETFGRDWSRM